MCLESKALLITGFTISLLLFTFVSVFKIISMGQLIMLTCSLLLILLFIEVFKRISDTKKVKEIKRVILNTSLSNNCILSHKNKWKLFCKSNIYVYLNGTETIENLLVIIPFYRQTPEHIENTIKEKAKNYLKPANEILKEISLEDIKEKLFSYCSFSMFFGNDVFGISELTNYDCDSDCENCCENCQAILGVYEKLVKIYHKLLDTPLLNDSKIIGQEEQTFKNLSLEEIVSAKYKNSSYSSSSQCERTEFVFNLLLCFYKNPIN